MPWHAGEMELQVFWFSLRHFLEDEEGAATVDWVVLTAVGIAMTLAVMEVVTDGVLALADNISAALSAIEIVDYGPEEGG